MSDSVEMCSAILDTDDSLQVLFAGGVVFLAPQSTLKYSNCSAEFEAGHTGHSFHFFHSIKTCV